MRKTLTIRLPDDLSEWLSETSRTTGVPQGQIVRDELDQARRRRAAASTEKPFMRLIGSVEGAPDLSQRKGFSKK